jgi:hypothetical protein
MQSEACKPTGIPPDPGGSLSPVEMTWKETTERRDESLQMTNEYVESEKREGRAKELSEKIRRTW